MVSAGDFRNGITLEIDNAVYQVIEFQHVKPGKGAAFVRTKLKDIKNGGVIEKTFRPTEKYPQAHIERTDMQYSSIFFNYPKRPILIRASYTPRFLYRSGSCPPGLQTAVHKP